MGMFDYVEIELEDFDIEPEREWKTKHRLHPAMETFRVDEDGLWLEEVEYYEVPEEERPKYNEEIGGFENDFDKAMGSIGRDRLGWDHWDDFHGMFVFYGTVDDEYRSFEAKFTDGKLEEIGEAFWERRDRN